ncbi:MAG: Uma2 family endonuclease [Aggregatilineales bacterium]
MAMPQPQPDYNYMDETSYLAFEDDSDVRHEYDDGQVYMMAGATEEHNIVASNINAELNTRLRGKPCRVYASDMRVQVAKAYTNAYRYPDIVVVCGDRNFIESKSKKSVTLTNPTVLIEILSGGTASVDAIQKLDEYRKISSLQAYVIIAQDSPLIIQYSRTDAGWDDTIYMGLEVTLVLDSIECSIALSDIYYNLEFENDYDDE